MTEVVLRDLDPALLERINAYADTQGWGQARTLRFLLEQGLRASIGDERSTFDPAEDGVLAAAIGALEQIPDDTFALIGRGAGQPSAS
ncbi:conserved hypothetical protein [Luteimonas sp. 9C]|uniref:hypothetical protein n=1 Tax=Luteimonas sp. 9C TaxID=2653148 RepID=UPI0012F129D8|nr:hypothetical protein [Luteimonas sp. 9C]VXB08710.1 conserved hypothetical protein [Luteimonas sp. 9C]